MIQSKKIFAAAALFGLVVTAAGLVAAPFSARAAATHNDADVIAERIGGAFAVIAIDPAATQPAAPVAAVRAKKGDIEATSACAGQTWPNIAARCLSTADGAAPRDVRFVTVGVPAGEAQTVLLRVPAAQVASR